MYGQQIGKLSQPQKNVLIEEVETKIKDIHGYHEITDIFFTIALTQFQFIRTIAEDVHKYTKDNKKIGEFYTDLGSATPFIFPTPFSQYLEILSRVNPRNIVMPTYEFTKVDPTKSDNFETVKYTFQCVGTNTSDYNEDRRVNSSLIATVNRVIEDSYGINPNKLDRRIISDTEYNGIIGYRFTSEDSSELEKIKEVVISASKERLGNDGILTLNQAAFMKEIFSELEYQIHKVYPKDTHTKSSRIYERDIFRTRTPNS